MSNLDKYKKAGGMEKALEDITTKAASKGSKMSEEERKSLYFNIMLPSGVKEQDRTIRILPFSDDDLDQWYKEEYYHTVEVINAKGVKETATVYDPYTDGDESPIREMSKLLYNQGTETSKELAKKFNATKYYILRIIERGKEHEGVKFWRIKSNYKNEGIFDKILGGIKHLKSKGKDINIHNIFTGRDLDLRIELTTSSYGTYSSVKTAIFDDQTPLHADEETMLAWAGDTTRTVRLAFPKKPIEYLEIIAEGGNPVWDREQKGFVNGSLDLEANEILDDADADADDEVEKPQPEVKPAAKTKKTAKVDVTIPPTSFTDGEDVTTPESDDLPF